MKLKIKFLIVLISLLIITTKTFAAMPDISAGYKSFDFSKGCYILKYNVRVVARGRTMTANEAKVQVTSQKVWANGNVTLTQEGFTFKCDSIFAQGKLKMVDVLGNVDFFQNNTIHITSNVGQFSWGSKIADFYGEVTINVIDSTKINFGDNLNVNFADINGIYAHIQYNVRENKILLLEKTAVNIPKFNIPEPDSGE